MRIATLVASSTLLFTLSAAADTPSIERLAPESSAIIVGVKNFKATVDRAQSTKLWELWQTDKVQAMVAEPMKELQTKLKEMYQELGVEEGSLTWPAGPVGFAMFSVEDPVTGMPAPGVMVLADFGPDADKVDALIKAANKKGVDEKEMELDEQDVLGRTVYTMTEPEEEEPAKKPEPQPGMDDEFEDEFGEFEMDEESPFDKAFKKMHYVRDGSAFIMSTSLESLTGALEEIDGKGNAGIEDRPDFQAVMQQVGESDLYAAVLMESLGPIASAGDEMGMMMMMVPMLQQFIGDIHAAGVGLRLNAPTAMVEQTMGIYMPNGKGGLAALLDTETPRGDVPAFIAPDALSYASVNFEFAGIPDLIAPLLNNPMFGGDPEAAAQIDAIIRQFIATLGTKVHMANPRSKPGQDLDDPAAAPVDMPLFAIESTNPQGFENLFGQFAGQMMLEPRDFLGQRIYSMDENMLPPDAGVPPMSLGVGGGHILIGSTPNVEQALRSSTGKDAALSLGRDPDFQRAVNTLASEPLVGWGYTNTVSYMENSAQRIQEQVTSQIDAMREFAPEDAEAMAEEAKTFINLLKDLDYDELRKYIGPTAWQMRATDDGFVITSRLLPAP